MKIKMLQPSSINELIEDLKHMTANSRIIAGGTDLSIDIHEKKLNPDLLVDVTCVKEMSHVETVGDNISIGAAVCFSDLSKNPLITKFFPSIAQAAQGVGSKQIRNMGTIGGNVANASPAGDMLPPLICLCGTVRTINSNGEACDKPLLDFIKHKKTCNVCEKDVITEIIVPIPKGPNVNSFVKLGNRTSVSIARLSIAVNASINVDNSFGDVKIILGALGKIPIFAQNPSNILANNKIGPSLEERFTLALVEEVDMAIAGRYSQAYKREAIKGLANTLFERLQGILN